MRSPARRRQQLRRSATRARSLEPATTFYDMTGCRTRPARSRRCEVGDAALLTQPCATTSSTADALGSQVVEALTSVANKFSAKSDRDRLGLPLAEVQPDAAQEGATRSRADSQHMEGNAVDFRVRGVPTKTVLHYVRSCAWAGFGYYPHSQFVHSDTGRIDTGPGRKGLTATRISYGRRVTRQSAVELRRVHRVALEAGALVAGRPQELAQRAVRAKSGAVGREGRPARRVGRVAGEAALLAVAGDAGADVALGLERMAAGARRGDHRAAGVARPARAGGTLDAGPGPERVVRPPPGQRRPSGSEATPVRWWQPTQKVCRRWHDEQSGVLRRASTTCSVT